MASDRQMKPRRKRHVWAFILISTGAIILLGSGGFVVAAHLEENDVFCASCHTQPESTFFDRTQSTQVVDLASQHHNTKDTVTCIDCHAGPGISGRLNAMTIGAGDLWAYLTRTATQPASLTVPIADENCLKCHSDIPLRRSFNQHYHAFLKRWQKSDSKAATCVSCHSTHTTDGEADLGFLNRDRTTTVCVACHRVLEE